jgi:hypothetical protein
MMLGAHGANGPAVKVGLVQVGHDALMLECELLAPGLDKEDLEITL